MTLEQPANDLYINRQHPNAVDPNGKTRFLRAAGEKRRRGVDQPGMPAASDVIVRSLDGDVLRIEPAQPAGAIPRHVPAPQPAGTLTAAPLERWQPEQPRPQRMGLQYDARVALRYAAIQSGRPVCVGVGCPLCPNNECFSWTRLALVTGVASTTALGWARRGIDPYQADRLAVALGVLPFMLWPEWLDESVASADAWDTDPHEQSLNYYRRRTRGLGPDPEVENKVNVNAERRQRKADQMRRRRQSDPALAELNRQQMREYRAAMTPAARRAALQKSEARRKVRREADPTFRAMAASHSQAYRQRLKADPERWAEHLAKKRVAKARRKEAS